MENKLVYLMRIGACWYIKGLGLWRGYCSICGKKRKTTAHHIFPKSIHEHIKNENLKEIRISVCEECDKLMHPENKIFREDEALKILSNRANRVNKKANDRALKLHKIQGKFISLKTQIKRVTDEIDNILNLNNEVKDEKINN